MGQHSTLAVRLMRGQLRPAGDFAEATAATLGRNTEELKAAVEAGSSAAAAARFRELWVSQVGALSAYADAVRGRDAAASRSAETSLSGFERDYAAAITELTGGELRPSQVAARAREHIDLLKRQADAYARSDWATSYQLEREAYRQSFATGTQLAGALVSPSPGARPRGFDEPGQQLQSTLGLLLGEHMELTVDATRAVVTGSPEAPSAARALDSNSRELGRAFAGALGTRTASQIAALWADHVDAVVAFAVATQRGDATAADEARAALKRFAASLGSALRTVAKGRVQAAAATAALDEHDEALLDQTRAFAARDYRRAHDVSYDGYQHMFAVAATLRSAVEGNVAARLPVGGAATGFGPGPR